MPRFNSEATTQLIGDGGESAPALFLLIVSAEQVITYPLPESGQLVIGRGQGADVQVDHPSVSRRHALLDLGSAALIEDLGSSNGTKVRGIRLVAGQRVAIAPNDIIELGFTIALVQQGRVTRDRTAAPHRDGGAPVTSPTDFAVPASLALPGPVLVDTTMRQLCHILLRASGSGLTILLTGEPGVGKETLARHLHGMSLRAGQPFLRYDCSSYPAQHLEAELLGRGGVLSREVEGTVFLRDVHLVPRELQQRLASTMASLRARSAAESGRLLPAFISSTTRDLRAMSEGQEMSLELYQQVASVTAVVPALRQRRDDIRPLAERFLQQVCARVGRARVPALDETTARYLEQQPWPGNVPQLRSAVEQAVGLCHGAVLHPSHFGADGAAALAEPAGQREQAWVRELARESARRKPAGLDSDMEELERRRVVDALVACAGNQTEAAKRLGISRAKLMRRLDRYGIARPRKPHDGGR